MRRARTCKSVLFIILFGCCAIYPSALVAQVVGATVSGTITDASGAATPGVTVAIKNLATQNGTSSVTNSDGFYIAPNLPAGEYQITVSAPGFDYSAKKEDEPWIPGRSVLHLRQGH